MQRSEGLLLRYLTEVYQVLTQTVPSTAKTDEIYEIETYLKTMVRQVDSSLLDEWEKMKNPNWVQREITEVDSQSGSQESSLSIFDSPKKLEILIRNEVFKVVRALSTQDFEEALSLLTPGGWTSESLQKVVREYLESGHSRICTDSKARFPKNTAIKPAQETDQPGEWLRVQQVLVDPDGHNDWMAEFMIDLEKSRPEGKLSLSLNQIAQI